MNWFTATVALGAATLLVACGDKGPDHTSSKDTQPQVAPAPPPKPSYTEEQWKKDYLTTYTSSNLKDEGDGMTSFMACFPIAEKECGYRFMGLKDGFRKVEQLTPTLTAFHHTYIKYAKKSSGGMVDMRVVTAPCKRAILALNPKLHVKTWLFMNKVAFMADGDVVYERSVDSQRVDRDVVSDGVVESWTFIVQDSDHPQLEKFAQAKSKLIRLSGDKGYNSPSAETVDIFAKDVLTAMAAVNAINKVLTDAGGPGCTGS